MLYRYGIRVGTSLLLHGKMVLGLKKVIQPVGYWRVPEYRFVLQEANFKTGERVLDIGSPKLLALYLTKFRGVEVYATDVDDYFVEEYEAIRNYQHISPEVLHIQTEDGRKLRFPDNFFDHVYCISTIEHIAGSGDSDCVREMARVLKPGGTALITTPFSPGGKVEYWDKEKVYWAEHTEQIEGDKAFYQRRYNAEEVQKRLIEPSGMKVRKLRFIGENVMLKSEREFTDVLPKFSGPLQPFLSRMLHTDTREDWHSLKKPLAVFICLEKVSA